MSAVMWVMKKSRLSQLIDESGGTTALNALREAERQLATLREAAMEAVQAGLAELEETAATQPLEGLEPFWLDEIYRAGGGLLDVAGPFGMEDMCAVAYSLCELVDRQKRAGRCDPTTVRLHVSALRLLTRDDQPKEARKAVVDGLSRLVERAARPGG